MPSENETNTPLDNEQKASHDVPASSHAESAPSSGVDIEALVNERVSAEKARLEQVLQKLGAPGLSGVDDWLQEREKKRAQDLAEKGRFQELYESERQARAELQQQMERTQQEALQRTRDTAIERALLDAATQSIAPKQVSALLRNRVQYDPANTTVYVVDDQGRRVTDGRGGYLSVKALVSQFLEEHPHFAPAAPGRGGAGVGPEQVESRQSSDMSSFDASRLNDPTYRHAAIEAVRRSLRR